MQKIKNYARESIEKLGVVLGTDMMYIIKGGFWTNANYLFVSFFGLLSSILFANLVTKDVYGTYQFVLAIAGVVMTFTPNNMNSAVVRAVAQGYEGELRRTTKWQIKYGVIASSLAAIISLWYFLHDQSAIGIAVLFVALFLPTANALNTWQAYMQGKKEYRRFFYYSVLNTLISYAGVFGALYFARNFIWIAFGNVFFGLIGNYILYKITLKSMRPNDATNPDTLNFGAHLSLMGIPTGLAGQLDALLVFHFIGAPALAIYSFATLLPEKISGGLKFISAIAFPRFSEKGENAVRNFLRKKLWLLLFFLAACAGIYAFFAPYLFAWLFPAYLSSVPYTQIYSLSFFVIAASVIQAGLTSQQKTKELYILNFVIPVLKIILLMTLIYGFGIWGVVWAQIITNVVSIILQMALLGNKGSAVLN